ncbi:MAG: TaqI-like C-terminal specificity domain-containing protein, partial [Clostridiales bacterium]|nr:TaqI-like C-terminal specificity domain-containing protein [Clostridiales bacterium]
LSVASHKAVRRWLIDTCSFQFVSYLGNAFSGVQCPAIILGVTPDQKPTAVGCRVTTKNKSFVIAHERSFDDGILSLHVSDEEYACLHAICTRKNIVYLKGNAKFALGIVTGSNREMISNEKRDGYEVILKGNDIQRYGIKESENFIRFTPEDFQQTAPAAMYRAKEKLLYRFISEVPVFAYDDHQTLSLNSCNILIPEIPGLEMKYVLAILNSSAAAFFTLKKFNSVKLLRSHIEQIPIPLAEPEIQAAIVKKVDEIMDASENISERYEDLDRDIMEIFALSDGQIQTIQETLKGKKRFLKV